MPSPADRVKAIAARQRAQNAAPGDALALIGLGGEAGAGAGFQRHVSQRDQQLQARGRLGWRRARRARARQPRRPALPDPPLRPMSGLPAAEARWAIEHVDRLVCAVEARERTGSWTPNGCGAAWAYQVLCDLTDYLAAYRARCA